MLDLRLLLQLNKETGAPTKDSLRVPTEDRVDEEDNEETTENTGETTDNTGETTENTGEIDDEEEQDPRYSLTYIQKQDIDLNDDTVKGCLLITSNLLVFNTHLLDIHLSSFSWPVMLNWN